MMIVWDKSRVSLEAIIGDQERRFVMKNIAKPAIDGGIGDATDMMRPRICEVLGGKGDPVELGERFTYPGMAGEFYITENGTLVGVDDEEEHYFMCASTLINCHDRIIRRPRFTDEEMRVMRQLFIAGARWLARGDKHLRWYARKPYQRAEDDKWDMQGDWGTMSGRLPTNMFPSIRVGQRVHLGAIIAAEAKR